MVLWYVPRIIHSTDGRPGRQMYRPAVLDRYARAVFFGDPEIATVINSRFVPVRLICDASLGRRFGISAPDVVEPAVLLLSPRGKPPGKPRPSDANFSVCPATFWGEREIAVSNWRPTAF